MKWLNIFLALTGISFLILVIYQWTKVKQIINTTMDSFVFPVKIAYHLNQLNPDYKEVFEKFIQGVINLGYTPQINSSYRTFAKQAELHNLNSSNARPGYSYHNYGLAIDMQMSKDGKAYGKTYPSVAEWEKTGVPQLARSLGLRWGNFATYKDLVHFDFPVKSTSSLLAIAQIQFGSDINNIKGNEIKIA